MLSVLIEAGDDQAALGASLATLVPGAIEGLVREVVVIDGGLDAATRKVAHHAGCRIVPANALAATVASVRGEWLLLIEPGARLSTDWIDAVEQHLSDVADRDLTPRAARFSRSKRDRPSLVARFFQKRTALTEGLLLPKAQAIGLAKRGKTLEEIANGIATRRLEATLRPRLPPRKP